VLLWYTAPALAVQVILYPLVQFEGHIFANSSVALVQPTERNELLP